MADRKQTFTPEFRAEVVRLAQTNGRSRREVAAGSPRMTHELREQGLAVGRRRVARLMRENGLKGPPATPLPAHDGQRPRLPDRA